MAPDHSQPVLATLTGRQQPHTATGAGPLAGVRVVDLTTTLMGPYCGLLLAQMGAEVTKIESPGGDVARFIGDRSGVGLGSMYVNFNRGKRSVELNLKDPADFAVLQSLVREADVFSHNMRPTTAQRLGLSYEDLSADNPRLVHCSMHGFDQRGPWRDKPAYDDIIQAAGGLASAQGGRQGPPAYVRSPVADKTVGVFAVGAILAALYEREKSGLGQSVSVPMFETLVAFMAMDQQGDTVYDPPVGPPGYVRMDSPHRRPYATADGYISVMVYTDGQWQRFFDLINRPDLAADDRFAGISGRTDHIDFLYEIVNDVLPARTTDEWLTILDDADIPAAPVMTVTDAMSNPQIRASGLFEDVDHPVLGRLRQVGLPMSFSRTPPLPAGPAETLGSSTAATRLALASVVKQQGSSGADHVKEHGYR